MEENKMGKEIGWEDYIDKDESEYVPLPEGVYDFTVISMTRGRFEGSAKMAPCNKASLDMVVLDESGNERHIFDDLILNEKMEWKIGQFFVCIGQKKKGERFRPRWDQLSGSTGKFRVIINEYEKNGQKRRNNRVEEYLPKEEVKAFKAGVF